MPVDHVRQDATAALDAVLETRLDAHLARPTADRLEPNLDEHTQLRNALAAAETERDELAQHLDAAEVRAHACENSLRDAIRLLDEIAVTVGSSLLDLTQLPAAVTQYRREHDWLHLAAGQLVTAASSAYEADGPHLLNRAARKVHRLIQGTADYCPHCIEACETQHGPCDTNGTCEIDTEPHDCRQAAASVPHDARESRPTYSTPDGDASITTDALTP